MNRPYTSERYQQIVDDLRAVRPDMYFSTDVIVGFPGESHTDFEATRGLVEEIGYDHAFLFKYSPRTLTKAARWEDSVADEEKSRRLAHVIALQEQIAAIMGKPAACFVPSGTMANQTAIRAHTEPGDEVIAHGDSHIIHYETGGPAALSGVMVRPLDGPAGRFDIEQLEFGVRAPNAHSPVSKLLVMENIVAAIVPPTDFASNELRLVWMGKSVPAATAIRARTMFCGVTRVSGRRGRGAAYHKYG